MSITVTLPYKPNIAGIYFNMIDEAGLYHSRITGLFEAYLAGNATGYKYAIYDDNDIGIYTGISQDIVPQNALPKRVKIICYDPATEAVSGPIGSGYVDIDKANKEIRYDLLLNYIFASTVGNNLGVSTDTEEYYGNDGFLAFTTIFDTNGNRQVTLAQG